MGTTWPVAYYIIDQYNKDYLVHRHYFDELSDATFNLIKLIKTNKDPDISFYLHPEPMTGQWLSKIFQESYNS